MMIQVFERYRTRARSFAGKLLNVLTRHGPIFSMRFDLSRKASLLASSTGDPGDGREISEGQWQHFPEGTAVKWNRPAVADNFGAGNFGLVSGVSGSLIYEGYTDRFSREPDFIAQVQVAT